LIFSSYASGGRDDFQQTAKAQHTYAASKITWCTQFHQHYDFALTANS
jgi:hypothetical protein